MLQTTLMTVGSQGCIRSSLVHYTLVLLQTPVPLPHNLLRANWGSLPYPYPLLGAHKLRRGGISAANNECDLLSPPRSECTIPTFVGHLHSNFAGAGPPIGEQSTTP
jgi:hypothetical protein